MPTTEMKTAIYVPIGQIPKEMLTAVYVSSDKSEVTADVPVGPFRSLAPGDEIHLDEDDGFVIVASQNKPP